jgi:hypothetical protein
MKMVSIEAGNAFEQRDISQGERGQGEAIGDPWFEHMGDNTRCLLWRYVSMDELLGFRCDSSEQVLKVVFEVKGHSDVNPHYSPGIYMVGQGAGRAQLLPLVKKAL